MKNIFGFFIFGWFIYDLTTGNIEGATYLAIALSIISNSK